MDKVWRIFNFTSDGPFEATASIRGIGSKPPKLDAGLRVVGLELQCLLIIFHCLVRFGEV
jgi:hypothetical protein